MRDILILTERDLRAAVPLDMEALRVVEGAFRALSGGSVVMPPILSMEIADAHGEVDVKTAYIPGLPSFAIKMAPGFFDNPKLGLPSVTLVERWPRGGVLPASAQTTQAGWVNVVATRGACTAPSTLPTASAPACANVGDRFCEAAELDRYERENPPRPAHWGGYRVLPERIEFWQGRENRLHDRLLYTHAQGRWKIERLAP